MTCSIKSKTESQKKETKERSGEFWVMYEREMEDEEKSYSKDVYITRRNETRKQASVFLSICAVTSWISEEQEQPFL